VRGLAAVMDRDLRRRHIERITQRAGVDLSAPATWLLLNIDRRPGTKVEALAQLSAFPADTMKEACNELAGANLIVQADSAPGVWKPTRPGCAVLDRIVEARREHLQEVLSEWTPGEQQDLAALMERLKIDLVPGAHTATDTRAQTK
jgi:hypothetical protein